VKAFTVAREISCENSILNLSRQAGGWSVSSLVKIHDNNSNNSRQAAAAIIIMQAVCNIRDVMKLQPLHAGVFEVSC
jgi:hypothetical protein